MFTWKIVPRLGLLRNASCALQTCGEFLNGRPGFPAYCTSQIQKIQSYSTAADNTSSPRWVQLEPELEDALVPRKLSVSPLESWLSLRYSLPPLLESTQPQEDVGRLEEKVLPPMSVPVLEDGEGSTTPIKCKNVLEIRRRKMNRHKYKKLLKRTKFLRRRVLEGRGRKKQKKFEKDLKRILRRSGLKTASEGWTMPKVFIKQHSRKRN
ncbi:aurora kinase A-interacting protein [Takifugu flavidus]|uniref:aurora kinase A-interacting protein n=1 Tax=Takifugu flavidus TaxID=433684 RepID=UPI002543FD65|nr:aurora kinase A-interacting protein [Takifugu flavidus]